jgi:hypothetical protein
MVPLIPYLADVLVLFWVLIMTVGAYGVARLPGHLPQTARGG